ncbi:hypothetical protein OZL92_19365 [Bacillus sonorensis]|uniref:Holin n=2 Tax=Bacillus sonorensis TaxID=119858 RepID=M5P920_9BACI|nr:MULTISPECIES: hypothetical protein [Bacillus]TWK72637.1 hypothetical protein CHCC20335_1302 [Bacillus paralicheniformis]ASB90310.1 hypothetical protein S101395_03804 [Bacillus sonorensis]EME75918.1 hypothetical protein BSONL12_03049 [Bacillus sonorensis L12]MBG9916510.1 hypothetical protein [Bacillus sonorensis]MCF7619553.1 hypothetical protein [Bacillus sonorensis]
MEFSDVAYVPLITGLVQTVRFLGIQKRFLPVFAIVFGICVSLLLTTGNWKEDMTIGICLGLSSVGFYSGSKNILKSSNKEEFEHEDIFGSRTRRK